LQEPELLSYQVDYVDTPWKNCQHNPLIIKEILVVSFNSCLLRQAQDLPSSQQLSTGNLAAEESQLIRFIRTQSSKNREIGELNEEDGRLVLRLAGELFLQPARFSRDLAADLTLEREELVRLYRVIRNIREIQDVLTFESPLRRRVSFLRKELLPGNIPMLKAMLNGDICMPSHVEFHPALICNLRCRACPNCQSDSNGEWHFLGYPELGEPLNADRLNMLGDLFLGLGVESFSFGGGGEPSLSDLTLNGIRYLRSRSSKAQISLYTNGIFPESWKEKEFEILVQSLDKIRFSIDAADAQEWSNYKGRPQEFFETLWKNIENVVACKKRTAGTARLGASCIVSNFTYRNVEAFLERARDTGLDFCDIKAVETCFGEKAEYKATSEEFREIFAELMVRIRSGFFAPLDVVVDDSLLSQDEAGADDVLPSRCWVAIRGRMLTVGPYAELHPCSDAANPGSQYRKGPEGTIGQITTFDSLSSLRSRFTSLWTESLSRRVSLLRTNCPYCVPSHNNYNVAVEKLFQDCKFGIMPEAQPFAGEPDHYLAGRGSR
jgi:MoaA/NifB/PqqE/SkfB family radical SAM enzyme